MPTRGRKPFAENDLQALLQRLILNELGKGPMRFQRLRDTLAVWTAEEIRRELVNLSEQGFAHLNPAHGEHISRDLEIWQLNPGIGSD